MTEHDDDAEQHPPRWVPYTPPPLDGWDRVRMLVRRLTFPLVVILFLLGVAGALYWSTQLQPGPPQQATAEIPPSREDRASSARFSSAPARLTVRSSPAGATVRLNGDSVGTTPLADRALPPGTYMLSVRAPDHFRADTVLVLGDSAVSTLRLSLRRRPGTRSQPTTPTTPPSRAPLDAGRPPTDTSGRRPLPVTALPPSADTIPPTRPAVGALYVTSVPVGARVTVDGTERGRTPLSLSGLPTGPARVTLSLDGYESWRAEVQVQPDTTRRVHGTLEPETGRLRVLARPWGTIYVNGTLHVRESDVWYETDLPAGTHRVTVVHPALGQRAQAVEVRSGEETAVVVDLQQAPSGEGP